MRNKARGVEEDAGDVKIKVMVKRDIDQGVSSPLDSLFKISPPERQPKTVNPSMRDTVMSRFDFSGTSCCSENFP